MQKKIIALAIASAISAPAFADNANITFYGKIITDVETVSSDKSNVTNGVSGASYSVTRVVSNASRFGLKGENDLGDGMTGWFQLESNVNLTNNDTPTSGTGAGTLATSSANTMTTNVGLFDGVRNSAFGIKSDGFGNLSMGNWDTPYKLTHNKIELFDNTTFASATNLMGRSGATAAITNVNAASTASSFVTRQSGVIQYWSPKFAGVDVKLAYAPVGTTYKAANGAQAQTKSVLAMSATYDVDALYVSAGYETHNDAYVASYGAGADTATRIVAAYKLDDSFWIGGAYENVTVSGANLAGTAVAQNSRSGVELVGNYKTGAHSIGLSYVSVGDMGAAANTGATQTSVRYSFDYSKRTQAFVMYSSLANKSAGQYALSAGQSISSNAGATFSGLGLGLQHTF